MGITHKCLSFLPWRTLHISSIFFRFFMMRWGVLIPLERESSG